MSQAPSAGYAFPLRLSNTGLALSYGVQSIQESIRIILLTNPGERRMLPEFGGGLRTFLYEPNSASTRRLIEDAVKASLQRWEKRITLTQVAVDMDPADPRSVVVTIDFRVISTGQTDAVSVSTRLASSGGE